jgi:hypothetical protein
MIDKKLCMKTLKIEEKIENFKFYLSADGPRISAATVTC